jgi:hypothetical protein
VGEEGSLSRVKKFKRSIYVRGGEGGVRGEMQWDRNGESAVIKVVFIGIRRLLSAAAGCPAEGMRLIICRIILVV